MLCAELINVYVLLIWLIHLHTFFNVFLCEDVDDVELQSSMYISFFAQHPIIDSVIFFSVVKDHRAKFTLIPPIIRLILKIRLCPAFCQHFLDELRKLLILFHLSFFIALESSEQIA